MTHSVISGARPKPLLLLILDGWGYRDRKDYNAIAMAAKPCWDHLIQTCPHTLLAASGLSVGLPEGQMGNSEVGHLTLGAGRVIYQDLTRVNQAIEEGRFFDNPVLLAALGKAKTLNKAVHVLGLLSPGGVHSHERHILALLQLQAQQGIQNCYIHAFLDGRDTPPKSAKTSLQMLEAACKRYGLGTIASLTGRYYAMDRDERWDRTEAAYNCLTLGKADYAAPSAIEGLEQAYARAETDEFVKPTLIHALGQRPVRIEDGDILFFMNFRADRARQLSRAFLDPKFSGFTRWVCPHLGAFVSLTHYADDIPSQTAFPQQRITHGLSECFTQRGLSQLRIAETEKYAHVTFFFDGGVEIRNPGETRLLVPSPKVSHYDSVPEMSVQKVTQEVLKAIEDESSPYDVIICNFANPDMLGHTGNLQATTQAIACVDRCIHAIVTALKQHGGEAIITADHGNAEYMYDEQTQQTHTAHTAAPVPFVYVGRPARIVTHQENTLADVAPSLLYLLGLPKPQEMTGQNLLCLS